MLDDEAVFHDIHPRADNRDPYELYPIAAVEHVLAGGTRELCVRAAAPRTDRRGLGSGEELAPIQAAGRSGWPLKALRPLSLA